MKMLMFISVLGTFFNFCSLTTVKVVEPFYFFELPTIRSYCITLFICVYTFSSILLFSINLTKNALVVSSNMKNSYSTFSSHFTNNVPNINNLSYRRYRIYRACNDIFKIIVFSKTVRGLKPSTHTHKMF